MSCYLHICYFRTSFRSIERLNLSDFDCELPSLYPGTSSGGDTFDKKENGDIKLKYDPDNNRYSTALEPWQKDPNQGYYRYSADDDEFKVSSVSSNPPWN